ncbi:Group XV phospholipase A2 [Operophtera brumata]|uniref:Group XV phospholipase A2 n=1 Tax=Operophtera brumata TaxID=104452 RepID=A0A0L7LII1_OPEBR|nr:Group XV phospholipase A2 [Operophtera brumata]
MHWEPRHRLVRSTLCRQMRAGCRSNEQQRQQPSDAEKPNRTLEARLNKSNVVHYICAKSSPDYFNIWLNLELLVPFVIDCWVDNLRLEYDNVTRTTKSPAGVDIRVPGWGKSEPVEWLDPSHDKTGAYFNNIADSLNVEFFGKLKTLIEDTYTTNNKTTVTLIVHSMGGLMAMHFLRMQPQSWKDQYIRRMISISTPWAGSMKAVKVFAIGDDLGSLMLRESIMRSQQITCPSLAWLLPSPLFWKPTEVLVQTDKFNYTIAHFEKLFNDMELPNAWEMRKDVEKYSQDFQAPGVEVHCIYGYNMSTVERLVYKPGTWLDGYPTLANGDGDGTVNLRSLSACEHWKKPRLHKANAGELSPPTATSFHVILCKLGFFAFRVLIQRF